ncbi:MAG: DUF86 domain-containing protein [Geminicoccaceae bacterium]|nr:MAG: DUF86 domain-containing protein [Geminicoccaceae bacterium]
MSREADLRLEDILESAQLVLDRTDGMSADSFRRDRRTVDAVLRNLEIIGEAVKHVPADLRDREPEIPWRQISGLRHVLAHAYFEVDLDLIWDIVTRHLRPLIEAVTRLRGGDGSTEPGRLD